MKSGAFIVFLVYLFFGLYFLNWSLGFIALPEFLLNAEKWLILVGAILIFIGAINYFRMSNVRSSRR